MKSILISLFAFMIMYMSFGQNDTIKSVHVKIKVNYNNNDIQQDIYYERINKDDKNLFFDDDNFKIIKDKIVKTGNYFMHIKDGMLVKTEHYKESVKTKTTKLLDSIGQLQYVIKCENNRLKEVEKYRNGRLVFRGKYGLIDLSEEFSYTEDGYVIYQKSKGVESKFEVIIDGVTGEIISKTQLSVEPKASVKEGKGGLYYVNEEDLMSRTYSELNSYCGTDNDE